LGIKKLLKALKKLSLHRKVPEKKRCSSKLMKSFKL
jgi:hypothetical protein